MVKLLSIAILVVAVCVLGHRVLQVAAAPVSAQVNETHGYGERWVPCGDGKMIYVGMKFNEETGEWVIVNYFTPPVSVDNRLGGARW